jgi:hypothetical protein
MGKKVYYAKSRWFTDTIFEIIELYCKINLYYD